MEIIVQSTRVTAKIAIICFKALLCLKSKRQAREFESPYYLLMALTNRDYA